MAVWPRNQQRICGRWFRDIQGSSAAVACAVTSDGNKVFAYFDIVVFCLDVGQGDAGIAKMRVNGAGIAAAHNGVIVRVIMMNRAPANAVPAMATRLRRDVSWALGPAGFATAPDAV